MLLALYSLLHEYQTGPNTGMGLYVIPVTLDSVSQFNLYPGLVAKVQS